MKLFLSHPGFAQGGTLRVLKGFVGLSRIAPKYTLTQSPREVRIVDDNSLSWIGVSGEIDGDELSDEPVPFLEIAG